MDRQKFAHAIRKAISDRDAGSPAERQKVYAAARMALGRQSNGGTGASAAMDEIISAIEASHAPKPEPKVPVAAAAQGIRRPWLTFGTGVVLGAFVVTLSIWALTPPAQSDQAAEVLERQYRNGLSQIPVAVEFLRKVSDAVIGMQKTDRAGLEAKASKSFVALSDLDPALAMQMPASLPQGSAIVVQANGFDFKILFNWTLCGAVRVAQPEMVDHVRSPVDVLGCPYFGLWTPAAANW